MTHGCSPFALTERKLTPLDIVTAHSTLPGKEDIALLLEEWMRGEGWTGGRMEERRRALEQRQKKVGKKKAICEDVGRILGVNLEWWGKDSENFEADSDSDEDEEADEDVYVSQYASSVDSTTQNKAYRLLGRIIRTCWFSPLPYSPKSLNLLSQITDLPLRMLHLLTHYICSLDLLL